MMSMIWYVTWYSITMVAHKVTISTPRPCTPSVPSTQWEMQATMESIIIMITVIQSKSSTVSVTTAFLVITSASAFT